MAVHLFHKVKIKFIRGLEIVDGLPAVIRIPVGLILLLGGFFVLWLPFINGMIPMIVGARMIGKSTFKRVYVWLLNTFRKQYSCLRAALIDTLKE